MYDGYLVGDDDKIVGEARRYDPYSGFGDIMMYEIDSFGFVPGFVKGFRLMSEQDLMSDENLRKSLKVVKYDIWKRRNIINLIAEYDKIFKNENSFDEFCKKIYKKISFNG